VLELLYVKCVLETALENLITKDKRYTGLSNTVGVASANIPVFQHNFRWPIGPPALKRLTAVDCRKFLPLSRVEGPINKHL